MLTHWEEAEVADQPRVGGDARHESQLVGLVQVLVDSVEFSDHQSNPEGNYSMYNCMIYSRGGGGGGGGGGVLVFFNGNGGVCCPVLNLFQTKLITIFQPYFRPNSHNVYPISDPVRCDNFSIPK